MGVLGPRPALLSGRCVLLELDRLYNGSVLVARDPPGLCPRRDPDYGFACWSSSDWVHKWTYTYNIFLGVVIDELKMK